MLRQSRQNVVLNIDFVPDIFIRAEKAMEDRLITISEKNAKDPFGSLFVIWTVVCECRQRKPLVSALCLSTKYCDRLHTVSL